jgi:hypothetical protein
MVEFAGVVSSGDPEPAWVHLLGRWGIRPKCGFLANLLTLKRHPRVVNGVLGHDVQYSSILIRGTTQGRQARWCIEEEIFNLGESSAYILKKGIGLTYRNNGTVITSTWLRVGGLPCFCGDQYPIRVRCPDQFVALGSQTQHSDPLRIFQGDRAHFHACPSFLVLVVTDSLATCEMEARASPRNPYVAIRDRSENEEIFDVVNRSASIGRSVFYWKFG